MSWRPTDAPGLPSARARPVGDGVGFGANVIVHDGTVIGDGCAIGDNAVLGKRPTLSSRSTARREPLPGR